MLVADFPVKFSFRCPYRSSSIRFGHLEIIKKKQLDYLFTLPIAKLLSVKNARAWVSKVPKCNKRIVIGNEKSPFQTSRLGLSVEKV